MDTRRVTTTEAAALLDVPPNQIRTWTTRRKVTPVGRTPKHGRHPAENIYLLAELVELAQTYHHRQARAVTPAAAAAQDAQASPAPSTLPSRGRPS
jgi:hypothetical protein